MDPINNQAYQNMSVTVAPKIQPFRSFRKDPTIIETRVEKHIEDHIMERICHYFSLTLKRRDENVWKDQYGALAIRLGKEVAKVSGGEWCVFVGPHDGLSWAGDHAGVLECHKSTDTKQDAHFVLIRLTKNETKSQHANVKGYESANKEMRNFLDSITEAAFDAKKIKDMKDKAFNEYVNEQFSQKFQGKWLSCTVRDEAKRKNSDESKHPFAVYITSNNSLQINNEKRAPDKDLIWRTIVCANPYNKD